MLQEKCHMVFALWGLCLGFQVATYPRKQRPAFPLEENKNNLSIYTSKGHLMKPEWI